MKSRFITLPNLRKFFHKHWHLFACAGIVLAAAVKKSWPPGSRSAHPAEALPNEIPAARPPLESDEKAVEKFTQNAAPLAAAPETEAKIEWPKMFSKKAGLPAVPVISEAEKAAFLKRFEKTAIEEQKKFGIPARLILASGLVQSFAGQRDVARAANNYFGLVAQPGAGAFESNGLRFQKFGTAWDSFRAHSVFVAALLKNEKKPAVSDVRAWAKLLAQKNGYSSVENWEKAVLELL